MFNLDQRILIFWKGNGELVISLNNLHDEFNDSVYFSPLGLSGSRVPNLVFSIQESSPESLEYSCLGKKLNQIDCNMKI